MPARSSRRSALLLLALAACKQSAPEADPAQVTALAAKIDAAMPGPSAVRECNPADLTGGTPLTYRALRQLAGSPVPADPTSEPTLAPWINPTELDANAVHDVLGTDATAKRRAAARLLAAKFFVVHRIDVVNAALALGIKDLKTGTIHARPIRFERDGRPTCVLRIDVQNTPAKTSWAIAQTTKAWVEPPVAEAMREDLKARWIAAVPGSRAAK